MIEVIIGFVGITFIMYILFFMLALPPKNGTQFTRPPRPNAPMQPQAKIGKRKGNEKIKRDTYSEKWFDKHMD